MFVRPPVRLELWHKSHTNTIQESFVELENKGKYLDFVIISAGHKERLLLVEIHAAHRSVVFVKLLQERAHPVVPQLHTPLSVIIITL